MTLLMCMLTLGACYSSLAAAIAVPTLYNRDIPADPIGVRTITSPQGATIRYKNPGICETMPGVDQYAGYVSLDERTNMFFWYFEARENPNEKPVRLIDPLG